jgi:EmrB/QacA subfamily drug resistance transporter
LSATDAKPPAGPMSRREIRGILFGVLLAMFLAALDQTIVAPALPTIARDLGQFNAISWVVTAYLLSATAATPILGKLSDLYGRRRLLTAGVGIFVLGSIACALAPGMIGLIIARAVQGTGGGALISLANTVIGDVVSPRERGRYQGYIAGTYALASIAGPVMGGYFAQYLSWTLIFWINLPLGLLAIHLSNRALRRLPVKGTSHRIDYLGSGLMAGATVCFLLALTWGGHRFAWSSPAILGLLLLVVILTLLFVARQRVALEPLLPLSLLANPVVGMAALIGLLVVMINISTGVYVPLFLQLDRGMTADSSGLVLIAPMVGIVAGALASGQYMRFVGRYRLPPVFGTAAAAASLWILGRGVESLSLPAIVALLGVVGLGLGSAMPPILVATQNAVDPRDLGIATASHTFFRSLGGAVGVALFGAVILGIMRGHLAALPGAPAGLPGDLDQVLRQGAASTAALPHLHRAFAVFFETAAALTLAATGALLALREIPLREHPASAIPRDVPAE